MFQEAVLSPLGAVLCLLTALLTFVLYRYLVHVYSVLPNDEAIVSFQVLDTYYRIRLSHNLVLQVSVCSLPSAQEVWHCGAQPHTILEQLLGCEEDGEHGLL